jgi:hypothetical protein
MQVFHPVLIAGMNEPFQTLASVGAGIMLSCGTATGVRRRELFYRQVFSMDKIKQRRRGKIHSPEGNCVVTP